MVKVEWEYLSGKIWNESFKLQTLSSLTGMVNLEKKKHVMKTEREIEISKQKTVIKMIMG